MSFTEVLDQQQSRIVRARDRYRECNRKLNHLVNQIEAADAWEASAIAGLNKQLEVAFDETREAMQVWNEAVDSMAVPATEPAIGTMAEWKEAAALMPQGYRIKDGWFHDSQGGRCNIPSSKLTQRQVEILIGVIPVS